MVIILYLSFYFAYFCKKYVFMGRVTVANLIIMVLFFLFRLFYQTKNKFSLVSIFCLDHMPKHVLEYIIIFHKSEYN